jgi:hypothetical protein
MCIKITLPFKVLSSNELIEPGFQGGNRPKLSLPQHVKNPMGLEETELEIKLEDEVHNTYQLTITSKNLSSTSQQFAFIEKLSEYLSFLINKEERNPRLGTLFVKVDWFNINIIEKDGDNSDFHDSIHVTDRLSFKAIRAIDILENALSSAFYHDILRFYFDGLRAEHKKSKYFHWFLILEYLENSPKYSQMFSEKRLFSATESEIIKDASEKMDNSVKKGALLNLLSRTSEFRSAKLLAFLNTIGISSYSSNLVAKPLTEDVLKTITKGRNAIFHSGSDFPDTELWDDLFPLVTSIVHKITIDKVSIIY